MLDEKFTIVNKSLTQKFNRCLAHGNLRKVESKYLTADWNLAPESQTAQNNLKLLKAFKY